MRRRTRSFGNWKAPIRIATRITRFATLSNMSAKNAFTSPPRNQGFRELLVKRSSDNLPRADERIPRVNGGKKQLDLFVAPQPPALRTPLVERLEREHAEAAAIAERLPKNVRFGTSSWSFPEWAGLVYSRVASVAELAREGLREYARHPLLKTVGIDRSYYAAIPAEDLVRYADQLPPGFPCCAKAPEAVTSAVRPSRSGG